MSGFLLQTLFPTIPLQVPLFWGFLPELKLVVALLMVFLSEPDLSRMGSAGYDHCGSFCGCNDFNGICAAGIAGIVDRMSMLDRLWRYDRLYLLCHHRILWLHLLTIPDIVNLHNWSYGKLFRYVPGAMWQVMAVVVLITTGRSVCLSCLKPIGAYQLGEAYAQEYGSEYFICSGQDWCCLSSILFCLCDCFCRAGLLSWVSRCLTSGERACSGTARPST